MRNSGPSPEAFTPPSGPEQGRQVPRTPEQLERISSMIQSQRRQVTLASTLPSSRERQRLIDNGMATLFDSWVLQIRGRIEQGPNAALSNLRAQIDAQLAGGIETPLNKDLSRMLNELEKYAGAGDRLNPMALLSHIDTCIAFLRNAAPLVHTLPPEQKQALESFHDLLKHYLEAMLVDNVPVIPGEVSPVAGLVSPQMARNVMQQQQTIVQLGGALILIPTALFFGFRALRSENGEGMAGAGITTAAALIAVYWHRIFRTGQPGSLTMLTPTERWQSQVAFLAEPGGPFPELIRKYKMMENGNGHAWGTVMQTLRERQSRDIEPLLTQRTPLTEEQRKTVLDLFKDSPVQNQLEAMMLSERGGEPKGIDFRQLVLHARVPRNNQAQEFVQQFFNQGRMPELLG